MIFYYYFTFESILKNLTKKEKEVLRIIKDNPKIRFKDLKKVLGISDPMLSKYITKLKDEYLVNYEKKGNSKLYTVNKLQKKLSENLAINQTLMQTIYNHFYEEGTNEFMVEHPYEFFDKLGNLLSGMFVYCTLKGINGNTNWTDEIDLDVIFDMISEHYFRGILDSNLSKITKPMTRSIYKTSSNRWKKIKNKLTETEKEELSDYEEALDLKYGNLITMLEGEYYGFTSPEFQN